MGAAAGVVWVCYVWCCCLLCCLCALRQLQGSCLVLELTLLGLAVVLDTRCCCDARTQRGSFVQSWKYRYFVLDDETLTYYQRKGGARKGVFHITRATECTRQTCFGLRLDLLAYDRRLTCLLSCVLF